MAKSWKEKLHPQKDLPEIKEIDCEDLIAKVGHGKMLIPAPWEIDEIMKKVPKGFLITTEDIRTFMNQKYDTVYACPLCTGIFSKIAAFAAEEEAGEGVKNTTPYWRTLKGKGELNEKYPGGIEKQSELLTKEGHKVIQKGKKFFVAEYQSAQFNLHA